MKKINNALIKKIIVSIILVLILQIFIMPNYSLGLGDILGFDGGDLVDPIFDFIVWIADSFQKWMQNLFVGSDDLSSGIKYSPAIIFSGELPAFDINFIEPNETVVKNEKPVEVGRTKIIRWSSI